jgi:hypothetical protein
MKNPPRNSNGRFRKYKIAKPVKVVTPAIPAKPKEAEVDYAKTYHTLFSDFPGEAIEATRELFKARPSTLSLEQKDLVFNSWIKKASAAYNIKPPKLFWTEDADLAGGGFYEYETHNIFMRPNRASVITFLHEFRHALQGAGIADRISEDNEIDARAWSLSLYYQVKPNLLRKLVLEGKVFHIDKGAFGE